MTYGTYEPINWKYVRIGECEITARTFNLLCNNGMEILGEVAARSESELRALPGFGRKALQEIMELLADYQQFRPDEAGARIWRGQLEPLLEENGEKLDEVVFEWGDLPGDSSPVQTDGAELDRVFYLDSCRAMGRPFNAHTGRNIYFVVKHGDGEFIRFIPKCPGGGRKPIHH